MLTNKYRKNRVWTKQQGAKETENILVLMWTCFEQPNNLQESGQDEVQLSTRTILKSIRKH